MEGWGKGELLINRHEISVTSSRSNTASLVNNNVICLQHQEGGCSQCSYNDKGFCRVCVCVCVYAYKGPKLMPRNVRELSWVYL